MDNRTDYRRGLDAGLELALQIINSTADVQFEDISEVALYLHDPIQYAHFKKEKACLPTATTSAT
jgi:hypothetical protein